MLKLFKKVVLAFFLLYGFNMIAVKFNIVIPINLFSVAIVSILDVPGLIALLISMMFILN